MTRVLVAAQEFIAMVRARPLKNTFCRDFLLEHAFSSMINNGKCSIQASRVRQQKKKDCLGCFKLLALHFGLHAQIREPAKGLDILMEFYVEQELPAILAVLKMAAESMSCEEDSVRIKTP